VNALRFRNRIAAWLALAGIALNASWPLLANAAPRTPALPSEICSATGQKHAGESPLGKTDQPSHCKLCPYSAERGPAILDAAPALLLPTPACEKAPASFTGSRLQTAPVLSGSPRSPPALS